jgi:hypothetical protein
MRQIVLLISLVAACAAVMSVYVPTRAEAQCTADSAGQPCCDAKIDDHWADPRCELKRDSLLSSALVVGGIVALIGLPLLFPRRIMRATEPPPTIHPDY